MMPRLSFIIIAFLLGTATVVSPLMAADGYTVANGSYANITEHSVCKKVTNNHASGLSVFVPTKTSTEWSSFYNGPPPGVAIGTCCKAAGQACSSGAECCSGSCVGDFLKKCT